MDVFRLRDQVIADYAAYVRSFLRIGDPGILAYVQAELEKGRLWPDPLVQLNPSFAAGGTIDDLAAQGLLHAECRRIFRRGKDNEDDGVPLLLHRHQHDALEVARTGASYVLTTGTGSGKSLAYFVPIVDHVLRQGSRRGIKAIVGSSRQTESGSTSRSSRSTSSTELTHSRACCRTWSTSGTGFIRAPTPPSIPTVRPTARSSARSRRSRLPSGEHASFACRGIGVEYGVPVRRDGSLVHPVLSAVRLAPPSGRARGSDLLPRASTLWPDQAPEATAQTDLGHWSCSTAQSSVEEAGLRPAGVRAPARALAAIKRRSGAIEEGLAFK